MNEWQRKERRNHQRERKRKLRKKERVEEDNYFGLVYFFFPVSYINLGVTCGQRKNLIIRSNVFIRCFIYKCLCCSCFE